MKILIEVISFSVNVGFKSQSVKRLFETPYTKPRNVYEAAEETPLLDLLHRILYH